MRVRPAQFDVRLADEARAVVEIYDDIGPSWAGMIDTKLVAQSLRDFGAVDEIEVRINSRGGSAFDGIGIHNVLKQHEASVTVRIDGVAASAASVIAMAGDRVVMPANTLMMIHEPFVIAIGNQDEMRKAAEMLGKINAATIESYHAKSGQPRQKIAGWLTDETWFTASEAVTFGLADDVAGEIDPQQLVTREPFQFKNPPAQLDSLIAGRKGDPTMAENQPAGRTPQRTPEQELTVDKLRGEHPELVAQIEADAAEKAAQATPDPAKPNHDVATASTSDSPADDEPPADPQQAAAAAVAAERKRAREIRALCEQAEMADKAQAFIDGEFTLDEVRAELFVSLCKRNKAPSDDGDGGPPETGDPDADYKAEYAQARAAYQREGITEEDYIATRRVDDGKDVLAAGSPQ